MPPISPMCIAIPSMDIRAISWSDIFGRVNRGRF
jgi:hypothetical protein